MKSFANSLPTLIHEIESLLYNAKNEKIKIAEKIERLDPHKYIKDLTRYSLAFVNNIKSLITAEFTRTDTGLDVFNYKNAGDYTFHPSQSGREFYEELEFHAVPKMKHWKFLIPHDEIQSENHLKNNDLGIQLSRKLVGVASLRRLVKVVSYCMYSIGMNDHSDSDIATMGHDSSRVDIFATSKAVSQMTRSQLVKLEESFKFLRSHILGISKRRS